MVFTISERLLINELGIVLINVFSIMIGFMYDIYAVSVIVNLKEHKKI